MITPPDFAIRAAVEAARRSPCAKSKHGAAVFRRACSTGCCERVYGVGWNAQPSPFACTGSEACRAACSRLCVHAEVRALRAAQSAVSGLELVHAKVVDSELVAGGGPSCWQCSREILDAGLEAVWLYEQRPDGDPVWRRYTAREFHEATAAACDMSLKVRS